MSQLRVKVIKPKGFDKKAFGREFVALMEQAERDILKTFQETCELWQHKVAFAHGRKITAQKSKVYVKTDDKIYRYVCKGTKPHRIPKMGYANLRFQWGGKGSYRPKSLPGKRGSRPGGPSGPYVHFRWVQHPGTEPRNFDKTLEKYWGPMLVKRLRDTAYKAAKASGHG